MCKAIKKHVTPAPAPRPRVWFWLGFWRGLAFATATLALVRAFYRGVTPPVAMPPVYVAVLVNQQTQAAWLVSTDVDPTTQQITIKTLHPQTLAPDKAFELWMLFPAPDRILVLWDSSRPLDTLPCRRPERI